jgi:hypothetical protein
MSTHGVPVAEVEMMPGVTIVLARSLDDSSVFEPGMELFGASAQPFGFAAVSGSPEVRPHAR